MRKGPSPPSDRIAGALLVGSGAAVFVSALAYVWPFTADDAFITFRYARNWVDGFGPNFNPDGARSEGVTSFGYLLISCVPPLLGIDPVGFAKALGVASAAGTAWLASGLARELGGPALACAFAAAYVLGFHASAIHAASGMETMLAAALMTALVQAHVRYASDRGSARAVGALSLAVGLARPELNVAAGFLLGLALWQAPARRAELSRAAAAFYVVPGTVYFAARAAYYGHALPIPFYAKIAGGEILPGAPGVLGFAAAAVATSALFLVLAAALAPRMLAPVWLGIGAVLALALLPDPVMNFDFRYSVPAIGPIAAAAGLGFARLSRLAAEATPRRATGPAIALATLVLFSASWFELARDGLRERRAYGLALESTYVRLGRILADYRAGSDRSPLLAIGDAGAIPYYSGWRVIDTFSLNDPAIAIAGRDDPEYVLDQRPDVVGVVSDKGPEFHAHWANRHDGPLFEAALAHGMKPAVILAFSARSYLYLMAQPDSDIARYLARTYLPRGPDRG
jgi:arabinofuranosyltransferase